MKTIRTAFACLSFAAAGALNAQAASADAQLTCGGVGNDERRDLAAAMQGANLSLEFSLAGRGNYIADVDVKLTPVGKGDAIVTARTEGPVCYVLQLPPGRYRIDASYNGVTKSATANVGASGKPVHLAMAFPPTAADIDPAPVSPEEKLQASKP
jgi:hypothetical protein